MINSNWHPISYRFGVIAAFSNFAPTRSLWLKISGTRGRFPPIIFARIVRPMNALQICTSQFSHRCYGWGATSENRAKIDDFANRRFRNNTVTLIRNFIFAPIVRPMYALQLCLWQYSHRCYGWGATSENISKIGDFAPVRGHFDPKFQVQGVAPTNNFYTVRPINALQLCRWQFSHKETL